jgi:3-oxoacyl-[acyl-carrier protein] reductase
MEPGKPGWIVVSGAGGAIGREVVRHYAPRHKVLALDKSFAATECDAAEAVRITADLTSEEEVRTALDQLPSGGSITLLVNAVGQIWNEPVLGLRGARLRPHQLDTWRRVIEANLTAPFIVANQVAARMARTGGGSIVNFSSIAAGGNAGQVAYSAAKAGIEGMTQTMAIELGPLGIRVNAVSLGFIDVATTRSSVDAQQLQKNAVRTPLGRLGAIGDVLSAIEFLAENTFVNGAVVKIDGGLRL